jgi:hypothetical protein
VVVVVGFGGGAVVVVVGLGDGVSLVVVLGVAVVGLRVLWVGITSRQEACQSANILGWKSKAVKKATEMLKMATVDSYTQCAAAEGGRASDTVP